MADSQDQRQGKSEERSMADQGRSPAANDAPGTMAEDRGDAKAEPSGYRGGNPSTAGPGETHVESSTPDNAQKQLDPSAPGETGTTPGSTTNH